MGKEKLIEYLEKFDYNFIEKNNSIFVKLELSQEVIISFQGEKIKITDNLNSWNFLTGGIRSSLKNALIYNFILTLIFCVFCFISESYGFNSINLFLTFITWVLIFSNYYLIKVELFKKQVYNWL